jgi:hypothetical protein
LPDVKLPASKRGIVWIGSKRLSKDMAINEQIVNISPTANHAHNGVDKHPPGVVISFGRPTRNGNMSLI